LIFDCHVHLPSPSLDYTWEWDHFTPDLASAITYLKHCRVDRIVANSVRGELAESVGEMVAANDEIAAIARDHPDYVVPACLINTNLAQDSLKELRRCRDELNIVWIGELCGYVSGFAYDTPAFSNAMRLAGEMGMIVQIHNDDASDMDRLCQEFPHITFVLAHLGDSPEEIKERIELAARHRNLYLDISGHGYQRMGILEQAVRLAGAERVLFGSDYTINDPAGVIARLDKSNFEPEVREMILGGNLVRLLTEHGWAPN
jgi:predicted TIM-barrel fold metal-dependent hydrolase